MVISEKQITKWLDANPDLQVVKPVTPSRQREIVSRETCWLLNVPPKAKPRMTANTSRYSDTAKAYWQWKDKITAEAHNQNLVLPDSFRVIFYIAMPQSWSKRKKIDHAGKEHTQRPDTDNMTKAIKDALAAEDSHIYHEEASKFWSYTPAIYIEKVEAPVAYAQLIAERYGL